MENRSGWGCSPPPFSLKGFNNKAEGLHCVPNSHLVLCPWLCCTSLPTPKSSLAELIKAEQAARKKNWRRGVWQEEKRSALAPGAAP